jgi:peptidoglycan/LPS O-acetylase OafA/YrhL
MEVKAMASRRGLAAFEPGLWAHYAAAIVAAWFFMSSLVWHDGRLLRSLDWILGLLAVGASVWALRESRRHWWISGLGAVILLLGAVSPHTRELSAWNERIVGTVLVLLGLVAGGQLPPEDT